MRRSGLALALALFLVLIAAACDVLPALPVAAGPAGGLSRIPLWSLLNQVYTGRVPAFLQTPRLPFEVLRRVRIVIDAPAQRLTVLVGDQVIKVYQVAVGKPETPTPIGHWAIKEKDVWAGGFGARWLGLNVAWGTYGIHGTNKPWSIGTRASGGCIRMYNHDVTELYELTSLGTPVTVRGPAFYRYGEVRRVIRPTHIGSDVAFAQRRLQDLGLYTGPIDGKYGRLTEAAVREYQRLEGLEVTGTIGPLTYERLGIVPHEDDPDLVPQY